MSCNVNLIFKYQFLQHSKEINYLLFLNVPDLVFEADKSIINVSLICLGRRGSRVQSRLQGAQRRLVLPRLAWGHLLLGRLHAFVLSPFRVA